jgi:hypothetical protein
MSLVTLLLNAFKSTVPVALVSTSKSEAFQKRANVMLC